MTDIAKNNTLQDLFSCCFSFRSLPMNLTYRGVPYQPSTPDANILITTEEERIFLGVKSRVKRSQVNSPRRSPVKLRYRGVTYMG